MSIFDHAGARTNRSGSDPFADMLYTQESSDRAIIDAVASIAKSRGVRSAQIAPAWLRLNPVVVAPIVGASKPSPLDDAVASLGIELTDEEVARLDPTRISARLGIRSAQTANPTLHQGSASRPSEWSASSERDGLDHLHPSQPFARCIVNEVTVVFLDHSKRGPDDL